MLHVWAFRNPTLFGYATLIDTLALLIEIQNMSIKPDKKNRNKSYKRFTKQYLKFYPAR